MYLSFYGQSRLGVSVSTPDLQMFDRSPANLAEFRKNQHQHQHFMKKNTIFNENRPVLSNSLFRDLETLNMGLYRLVFHIPHQNFPKKDKKTFSFYKNHRYTRRLRSSPEKKSPQPVKNSGLRLFYALRRRSKSGLVECCIRSLTSKENLQSSPFLTLSSICYNLFAKMTTFQTIMLRQEH